MEESPERQKFIMNWFWTIHISPRDAPPKPDFFFSRKMRLPFFERKSFADCFPIVAKGCDQLLLGH